MIVVGVRSVARSITFQKCGVHVPHYKGNAGRIMVKYVKLAPSAHK